MIILLSVPKRWSVSMTTNAAKLTNVLEQRVVYCDIEFHKDRYKTIRTSKPKNETRSVSLPGSRDTACIKRSKPLSYVDCGIVTSVPIDSTHFALAAVKPSDVKSTCLPSFLLSLRNCQLGLSAFRLHFLT